MTLLSRKSFPSLYIHRGAECLLNFTHLVIVQLSNLSAAPPGFLLSVNLLSLNFQFCVQVIYKDVEEHRISSSLPHPFVLPL